jgi:hypothetical protein
MTPTRLFVHAPPVAERGPNPKKAVFNDDHSIATAIGISL